LLFVLEEIPEKELMKKWFPEGKIPQLKPLQVEYINNSLVLKHVKKDASIVWKKEKDSIWQIYVRPIKKINTIIAKAVRIGYLDSPLFTSN